MGVEQNAQKLKSNANRIVDNGKGILAADESPASIEKRFDFHNIENTEENRRKLREIMISMNGLEDMVGGVILHEETFGQCAEDGRLLVDHLIEKGVAPGIKLDKGLQEFDTFEQISIGLEDLDKRLKMDIFKKAIFAKWRSVFSMSQRTPTTKCIDANCDVLAKYSLLCQKHGIVPIVEPELLWDGNHTIERAKVATKTILSSLMYHLNKHEVYLPGVLVKIAFVTSGKETSTNFDPMEVAKATYNCIRSSIPPAIAGIVFLSGGHTKKDSTLFLDGINKIKTEPYILTFSYGRALSDVVLKEWKAKDENVVKATKAFEIRLKETYQAAQGKYE